MTGVAPERPDLAIARVLAGGLAAPDPMTFDCPRCGEPVELPAKACIDFDERAQVLVNLDPSREHAKTHGETGADNVIVIPAALETLGVPW